MPRRNRRARLRSRHRQTAICQITLNAVAKFLAIKRLRTWFFWDALKTGGENIRGYQCSVLAVRYRCKFTPRGCLAKEKSRASSVFSVPQTGITECLFSGRFPEATNFKSGPICVAKPGGRYPSWIADCSRRFMASSIFGSGSAFHGAHTNNRVPNIGCHSRCRGEAFAYN
jgi:hypothetical protein